MPLDWSKFKPLDNSESQQPNLDWSKFKSIQSATYTPKASFAAREPDNQWDKFAEDLQYGGGRSIAGKVMGWMQGRGSKGYEGLPVNANGSEPLMNTLPLGIAHFGEGVSHMREHPVAGVKEAGKGLIEALTLPSLAMGPESVALEGAKAGVKGASSLYESIPNAKRAGKAFDELEQSIGGKNVNLSRTKPALEALKKELDAGGPSAKPINKLIKRLDEPTLRQWIQGKRVQPMDYSEARRFYTKLNKLSRKKTIAIRSGGTGVQLDALIGALRADIGDTANAYAQGAKYYAALNEMRKAKRMATVARNLGKIVAGGVPLAAGAYEGAKAYNALTSK